MAIVSSSSPTSAASRSVSNVSVSRSRLIVIGVSGAASQGSAVSAVRCARTVRATSRVPVPA